MDRRADAQCSSAIPRSLKPKEIIVLQSLRVVLLLWTVFGIVLQGPLSVAFAQTATGAGSTATAGGVVSAPFFPVPVQPTVRQVQTQQKQIFESLFGQPYDPDEWTYPLDDQVTGVGTYSGANYLGQPFDLEILISDPVDITDPTLDLTTAERQFAIDNGFEYRSVLGILSSDLAWIPVSGLSVFQSNATIPFDSRFMVSGKEDPNNPLFNGGTQALTSGQEGGYGEGQVYQVEIICVEITLYCREQGCADDCHDAYDEAIEEEQQAVDDAQAAADAAQDALDAAQADYDANIDQATQDLADATLAADAQYATDMQVADVLLAAALTGCSGKLAVDHIKCTIVAGVSWWLGGAPSLGCVLWAQAKFLGCTAVAGGAYALAEWHASQSRANTIAPFQQAIDDLNTAVSDAVSALNAANQALQEAMDDLQDAMDEAQEELEDCLGDCPLVVCGYIEICIIIIEPGGGSGGGG